MSASSSRRKVKVSSSLYVHIPFCRSKCFYCSFDSWAGRDRLIGAYLVSLSREAASYHGILFETLYIGGGTPTHLSVEHMGLVFEALNASVVLARGSEVTVEVNPASCDAVKAEFLAGRTARRTHGRLFRFSGTRDLKISMSI
jgi:oxygen-independent coproporphyrinogen-3 oxidase